MSKKADIVNATKTLLWNLGYEAMSPKKIMDASGAGQGSLYHHFSGKEQLAVDVLKEVAKEMKVGIDCLFEKNVPPLERIRNFLLFERDALKGCPLGRLANEAIIEKATINKPISSFFCYVEKKIELALRDAIEQKEINQSIEIHVVAINLLATLQGGFILSRIHNDPEYLSNALQGAINSLDNLKK